MATILPVRHQSTSSSLPAWATRVEAGDRDGELRYSHRSATLAEARPEVYGDIPNLFAVEAFEWTFTYDDEETGRPETIRGNVDIDVLGQTFRPEEAHKLALALLELTGAIFATRTA